MRNPFGFFGLGLSLFTLAFNLYAAWWVSRRFALRPLGRLLAWEAALLLSAVYPLARAFSYPQAGPLLDLFMWLGFFVLGASFVIFWVLAACDLLLALAARLGASWARGKAAAAACAALAVLMVGLALHGGLKAPELKRIELPVKGLPARLDGFSVLQISDLHLGRMVKLERLEAIAAAAEAERPDMIAITGDFSERRERMPEGVCEVLLKMKAPAGKFSVLGNHDLFADGDIAAGFFEGCGFKTLRGEALEPVPGLQVAGVEDLRRGDRDGAKKLAPLLDRSKPLIFLSHQPQGFGEVTAAGSGLVLSGHTHKGQIFPFALLEAGMFEYFYGLYRTGDYHVYVTAGAATWGPPLRLFADPELPLLVLRSAP